MKYVIIIDSFRSHNALAYASFGKGIMPIHVFSSKKTFTENFNLVGNAYFVRAFVFENLQQFAEDIKEFKDNIQFVFACTDESQFLKDKLDNFFALPNRHNHLFAPARNNKLALYKLLGQPASDSNFTDFVKTHKECIIKPDAIKDSGGCIDVSYVTENTCTVDSVSGSFISKYFHGDEYAVDFVSSNGKHKLVAVWKYIRNADEKIWKQRVVLMHYGENPELVNKLYNKASEWLNKLDHKFGPVHMEVKINGDDIFCIEINFRLNGHMHYSALMNAMGSNNQADLTADAYFTGSKFSGDLIAYKVRGYISRIYLLNTKVRKFSDIPWQLMEKVPSVINIYKHVWPWKELPISTKTYQGTTAIAILFNEDDNDLLNDEIKVLEMFG